MKPIAKMYLFYNHPLQSYGFRWYKSVVNSAIQLLLTRRNYVFKSMYISVVNYLLGNFNEDEY